MSELEIKQLLAPLVAEQPDASLELDRDAIIDRMVEVSAAPAEQTSPWARWGAALAVAAGVVLAVGAGAHWLRRSDTAVATTPVATAPRLEIVALRGPVPALAADGSLATPAGVEARIRADGLELDLAGDTRVSLRGLGSGEGNPTLRLERGRVRCTVAHRPGRTFSVVTPDLRAVDVGTVFSVSVEPPPAGRGTVVSVEEGEVMVHRGGSVTRLIAPQSFDSAAPEPAPAPEGQPAGPGAARPLPKRPRETLAAETQLLRSGLAAEQMGDLRGAARAFEKLVTRYPASPLVPDAKESLARVKRRLESRR